jgi:class 3 adenylate cyclase
MHREFRKLLDGAAGNPEHVIAIIIDIRGFSDFCQKTDSYDVANYVRRVYMKIIDDYFSDASYYKPTGDGLLIIQSCPNESIKDNVEIQVQRCLNLLKDFERICKDDLLVYFETPKNIGIGMSRGSACRISSKSKTLDYSGRVINLSSRLMDLARPSGIVFDASLGFHFLPKKTQEQFLRNDITYVRGIAEKKPIAIYYTKQCTILPHSVTQPLKEPLWKTQKEKWSGEALSSQIIKERAVLGIILEAKPTDPKQIVVSVYFVRKGTKGKYRREQDFSCGEKGVKYKEIGRKYEVLISRNFIRNYIKLHSIKSEEIVEFLTTYPTEQTE